VINLHRLDLNLLRTLDVLLSENNVTRAAQRLNLSQPSVSIQLARLREIFADPLLMPGPRGMQPTARADELRQPLRAALAALEQAVAPVSPLIRPRRRRPGGWRRRTIWPRRSSADAGWVTPGLSRQSAGGIRTQPARLEQQAASDDSGSLLSIPARARRRGCISACCFANATCWLAGRASGAAAGLSLETFCQLEHVIVSRTGRLQRGDRYRAGEPGLTRRVVLSVPHFLFMLETLRNSDLVAVLPERLVRGQSGLVVVEPPLAVAGFEMLMLWHERWHRDPAHQWLRQFIVNSLEEQTC
jgi:DNA-binding transcriptional LysR family regulator